MDTSTDRIEAMMSEISRRRLLQLMGLGAVGMVLETTAACAPQSTTPAAATPGAAQTPTTAAAAQPRKGGSLRWAQAADISPKGGHALAAANLLFLSSIYDRLISFTMENLTPKPELAESWKFSADFASITMKLRAGVKFHSGRAFTAQDVKWNLEKVTDPKIGSQLMNPAKWITKIEIPDANTITLTFDKPRPYFLDALDVLFILDPDTFEDAVLAKKFIGTGPFLFKEWVPGDHYTLTRNPEYWRKDRPYLDEIVTKVIPEAQTALINLQSGAIDATGGLDPRDTLAMTKDAKFVVQPSQVVNSVWYLGADVTAAPFKDKRVRQAMNYLIDRKRMVDTVLFFGDPMVMLWDKSSPAYVPEFAQRYTYDPKKAKALLDEAGVAAGTAIPISVPSGIAQAVAMAEVLQAELAALGMKASVEKLDTATFTQKLTTGKYAGMWISYVGYVHLTPSTLFVMSLPLRVPNSSNFTSPEYLGYIDEALKLTDEAELKKLYRKIDEFWLDECFVMPIAAQERPLVLSKKVHGFVANRSGIALAHDIWKSE